MPTGEKENSKKNLELGRFKPGVPSNPLGKKPGTRNRATIARQVLGMLAKYPDKVFDQLAAMYPELSRDMTMEEMILVVQSHKAISKADTQAAKLVLESAYGLPKQEIDVVSDGKSLALPPINFTKKEPA